MAVTNEVQDFNSFLANPKLDDVNVEIPGLEEQTEPEKTEDPGTSETEVVDTAEVSIREAEEAIEEAETEVEEAETEESAPSKRKLKPSEQRIRQLVEEKKQWALMAQQQSEQLALLQRQINQTQPKAQEEYTPFVDPSAPQPPDAALYDNEIKYQVAIELYKRDLDAYEKQQVEHTNQMIQKLQGLKQIHPDIDDLIAQERIKNNAGIRTSSPAIEMLLRESERSEDLWYYLMSHQDEAAQIARMNQIQATKAITKIELNLETPKTVTVKKPLPSPITPIKQTKPIIPVKQNFGFMEY